MSDKNNAIAARLDNVMRKTLWSVLAQSFERAGYEWEESVKLAEIAIGPVESALDLAQAAYKLHLEAVEITASSWPKTITRPVPQGGGGEK